MRQNEIIRYELNRIFEDIRNNEETRINKYNQDHNMDLTAKYIQYDGYVGDPEEFNGIMFVGEEANSLGAKAAKGDAVEWKLYDFWVKKVIDGDYGSSKFVTGMNMFYKALQLYINSDLSVDDITVFLSDKKNIDRTDYSDLNNIAYINLKKTGGRGKINQKETKQEDGCSFNKWVEIHSCSISTEINHISPRIAVILGVKGWAVFDKNIKSHLKETICLYANHPSRWSVSKIKSFLINNKESLNRIKCLYIKAK